MASLQLPIVLTKLSYLIDNPWTVSLDRANAAGLILADSLVERNLGVRPITLVGFSLGSRVIFSCLRELANKGAFGLIQNVYLFGSPIVAKKDEYLRARMVVSGRFVNGYASNDWILGSSLSPSIYVLCITKYFLAGYLFRATSGGIMRIAGLAPVEEIPGVENINVTELVNGHMAYRTAMPRLLREVGWEVESDEFTEIEDPDPENHEKRQRELIREIDEARKEAETKPEKRRFGFFKRGKLAEKKGWETYDERMKESGGLSRGSVDGASPNVLFDIDAIRAELASEQIEVRQLESTLPPMKLDLSSSSASANMPLQSPYTKLRETKSYDASIALRAKPDQDSTQFSMSDGHVSNPFDKGYDEYDDSNELGDHAASTVQSDSSYDRTLQFRIPDRPSPDAANIPAETPFTRRRSGNALPAQSPDIGASSTIPTNVSNRNVEHNGWCDYDEDEDFGKERQVQMSFE